MKRFRFFHLVFLLISPAHVASGQTVQLPTAGSFQLSTSMSVPDSGSTSLGSMAMGRAGNTQRGPMGMSSSGGSAVGASGGSVHATVIDLDELDSMIRAQSGKISTEPDLLSRDPREKDRKRAAPRGRLDSPDYDYLIALSRYDASVERGDPDAVKYYLGMAERARNRGAWSAVELYYKNAWRNLA
ncbi:MAG: hypothetical protein FJ308_24130, partial [Planctomycetes bacterium]|nr:hypothetical protein [Planctomycetota bacterium]